MSVIAAMGHAFKQIVTFGEPRVGAAIGAAIAGSSPHIRYVNGRDPVTRMVPTFWPFSYEHHGQLKSIVDHAYGGPMLCMIIPLLTMGKSFGIHFEIDLLFNPSNAVLLRQPAL